MCILSNVVPILLPMIPQQARVDCVTMFTDYILFTDVSRELQFIDNKLKIGNHLTLSNSCIHTYINTYTHIYICTGLIFLLIMISDFQFRE